MPPKKETVNESDLVTSWDIAEEVAAELSEPLWAVKNVIRLLKEENTIPFIARYRKEQTNNMDGEKLREMESFYEELLGIQNRISSIVKTLEKSEKLTPELKQSFANAKTASEVEHLYQPFKTGNKRTMARRAIELGLEPAAEQVLSSPNAFNPAAWIKRGEKGRETVVEVETGVQHIIADRISKDKDTIEFLIRDACGKAHIMIEAHQSTAAKKEDKDKDKKENAPKDGKKVDNNVKFENYFNFKQSIRSIRPHQVLAINRGESLKVLTVKIEIPEFVKNKFFFFCERRWLRTHPQNTCPGARVVKAAIEDSYARLMIPLITRHFRNELKKMAEKASLEVFRENLKNLLLAPPCRGQTVLGIDPGFRNGCKLAVVDVKGEVLETDVVHLAFGGKDLNHNDKRKISDLIRKHQVDVLAIGNGTACRETEVVMSSLLNQFPHVSYVIVDESGASIYSVTPDAEKELPGMDPNLRSAVSIGRRLQDPLAELVKIEPRHIGVGMYQHDIDEKQLKTSLDKIVEDCVSFVGVDLNTASTALLTRIAGLTSLRAKKIVDWREDNGAFVNRDQLKLVSGLGPKSFEQCAGFLRINPQTVEKLSLVAKNEGEDDEPPAKRVKTTKTKTTRAKTKKAAEVKETPDILDMTCIHPESYASVKKVVQEAGLNFLDFQESSKRTAFQDKIRNWSRNIDTEKMATDLSIGAPTLDLIVRGLTQPIDFDLRNDADKPLFRKNIASMKELHRGIELTGRVTNVTHFGAFVDVGVERQGLIHVSRMGTQRDTLSLGDRVQVTVLNVDFAKGRIELELRQDNNNKVKIKLE